MVHSVTFAGRCAQSLKPRRRHLRREPLFYYYVDPPMQHTSDVYFGRVTSAATLTSDRCDSIIGMFQCYDLEVTESIRTECAVIR